MSRFWLRLPDEATVCVACGSSDLHRLDALPVPRTPRSPGVAFLAGCGDCGLVFVDPMPEQAHLDAFYAPDGAWAQEHAEQVQQLAALHARRLAKNKPRKARPLPRKRSLLLNAVEPYVPVFAPPAGARVLDFGCGDGKLLNTLQDLGWQTFGIEPSTDIAFLRHQRVTQVPADRSFDFIVLHHVLEHVADPLAILREIAAGMRDGGILYVIVPRLDTLPQHGDYRYCINGRNHLLAFTEVCLRGLLARAGFETVGRPDSAEMDQVFTDGQPLRLRLIARRTPAAVPLPVRPLDAATRALNGYAAAHAPSALRLAAILPLRVRAAWLLKSR